MLTQLSTHVMRLEWGRGRLLDESTNRPPSVTAASATASLPRDNMHRRRYLMAQSATLATGFQRFLARFSGRRRWRLPFHHKNPPPWAILVLVLASSLLSIVDACSSRTTPKPRPPPAPTPRPNITFHTYECPPAYAAWYCLNGATCFTVKIGDSLLYNCECAEGFMGPRCEYKDLDGSYLPAQRGVMLERASIAGGVTVAVFLVVILCVVVYLHYAKRHNTKASRTCSRDCVDGVAAPPRQPTFGTRWRQQQQQPQPAAHAPLRVLDRGDIKQSKSDLLQHVTTLVPPPAAHFNPQEP